jgi:Protein of unknown function (DUF559)
MDSRREQLVRQYFREQHCLVQDDQLRRIGISRNAVAVRVRRGEWDRPQPGVLRLTASAPTAEQALLAACLSADPLAAASHRSAVWMWRLAGRPPDRPEITVPRSARPRLAGVIVHRSGDLDPSRTIVRNGIPCTDALRALYDLAAVAPGPELTEAVDKALATRLVTAGGLVAELGRRSIHGRPGTRALRAQLEGRGLAGGPEPSVLESEALRFFARSGIEVLGHEIVIHADGRYRIDFLLGSGLIVEVDGYAFHWSPEAKRYDEERRNRLRLEGHLVLVYSWRDIRFEHRRIAREIWQALHRRVAG